MYASSVDFAGQNNGNYMQMQNGNMHPQQAEWLMQPQRMQGNQQAINASRVYHLEPMNVYQQPGQLPPQQQQQMQHPGNALMMNNGMGMPQQYNQMGMPAQVSPHQQMNGAGGGYNGVGHSQMVGNGVASPHSLNNGMNGNGGSASSPSADGTTMDWNQINFHGVFYSAADPQTQQSLMKMDDGKPLPFPPSHLLARYPPEYQQQMVFYYRLLRLQYPELYQQYVDYYETFYEPLYFPSPSTPEVREHRAPPPKKKNPPPPQPQPQQQQQPRPAPPPQPVAPLQPVAQPLPPSLQEPPMEVPPKRPEGPQPSVSSLGGNLSRQSSMRRQNSMRRAEVNQLKNEGGLKRLPSMRKTERGQSQ
jgi:hypothetical protein